MYQGGEKMGIKQIPVSDLEQQASQTIRQVKEGDAVYITQHGRPQAVLIGYNHYETLLEQAKQQRNQTDPENVARVRAALQNDPEFQALIEQIKSTPPNPALIRPATESLADLLKEAPEDPDFDLETWTKEWAAIETEMKAIDRANDIAEGRG